MNIKKILFGEKTPDRDDPEYEKLRAKSEAAGLKTSKFLRLDKATAAVQRFAERHRTLFFGFLLALSILIACAHLNRIRIAMKYRNSHSTAIERQEQELHFNRHHIPGGSENGNNYKDIYYEGSEGSN